jgi:hypothetical protein
MGIIKRGILGGFSGKVANVVGSNWKGRAVLKSLPLSVANPRTAQQVENRNAMSFASRIGSQLLSGIIIPLNNRFAGNISGYNAFVQRFKNANPTAPAGITQLPISEGKMLAPASASLSIMSGVPTLSWTNPTGDAFALPTDKVYYAIANWTSDGKEIVTYCGYTGVTRADQPSVVLTLDDYDFLDAGRCSVAYLREDGSVVSSSKTGFIMIVP